MKLEFDLLRWQDKDLLSLILRHSEKPKIQILREIFQAGLKATVENMLTEGKLKGDRVLSIKEIVNMLEDKPNPCLTGFESSSFRVGSPKK